MSNHFTECYTFCEIIEQDGIRLRADESICMVYAMAFINKNIQFEEQTRQAGSER